MNKKYFIFGSISLFIVLMIISYIMVVFRRDRIITIQPIESFSVTMTELINEIDSLDVESDCKASLNEMSQRIVKTYFKEDTKLSTYYKKYFNGKNFIEYYLNVSSACNLEENTSIYIDALTSTNYPDQIKKEYELALEFKFDDFYSRKLINKDIDKNGTYSTKTLELRVLKKLIDEVKNE